MTRPSAVENSLHHLSMSLLNLPGTFSHLVVSMSSDKKASQTIGETCTPMAFSVFQRVIPFSLELILFLIQLAWYVTEPGSTNISIDNNLVI